MKKIFLLFIFLLSLASTAFASPEVQTTSGLDESVEIRSSDSNNIKVENVEKVIDNTVDLSSYTEPRLELPGLDEVNSKRTCPYCWLMMYAFGLYLVIYGEYLFHHKNDQKMHWFVNPVIAGIIVYFFHGLLHQITTSSIFIEYYWMIIFDELLLAYFYYSKILKIPKMSKNFYNKQQTRVALNN